MHQLHIAIAPSGPRRSDSKIIGRFVRLLYAWDSGIHLLLVYISGNSHISKIIIIFLMQGIPDQLARTSD